jgi:Icc-related predicted phosphoesterase
MIKSFFVTDLHGKPDRYRKLFNRIECDVPEVVFFGGDLLPHRLRRIENYDDFTLEFLLPSLREMKRKMDTCFPEIYIILGNDDARNEEIKFIDADREGLLNYINQKKERFRDYLIFGYSFVPPSPFQLKDWEKYDISRYVDPGCVSPNEGFRTYPPDYDPEYDTIHEDIKILTEGADMAKSIFLFHTPPYKTNLDRAELDGKFIDHVPIDVHVGSIAVKRLIDERQPYITLHGHIHESTRITGSWFQKFGNTVSFNGSHDGNELCITVIDLDNPESARRITE